MLIINLKIFHHFLVSVCQMFVTQNLQFAAVCLGGGNHVLREFIKWLLAVRGCSAIMLSLQ